MSGDRRPRTGGKRRLIGRRTAVLVGIVLAAALLGTARATWITASVEAIGGGTTTVPVTGTDAAPAVLALAIVALAASLATAISSRLISVITGPVLILAGVGALAASLAARADPAARAASRIAESTGLLGRAGQSELTAWPTAAVLPAALLAVLGVLVLLSGPSWPRASRYERDAAAPAGVPAGAAEPVTAASDPLADAAGTWDMLSRGEDPTENRSAGPGAPGER